LPDACDDASFDQFDKVTEKNGVLFHVPNEVAITKNVNCRVVEQFKVVEYKYQLDWLDTGLAQSWN